MMLARASCRVARGILHGALDTCVHSSTSHASLAGIPFCLSHLVRLTALSQRQLRPGLMVQVRDEIRPTTLEARARETRQGQEVGVGWLLLL